MLHDLARTALGISAGRSGTGVRPQCIGAIGGVPPVIAPPTVKLRTPCDFRGSPSFSLLEVINLTFIPSNGPPRTSPVPRPRCAAVAEERPRVALVRPADRRCWASSSAAAQRQASTVHGRTDGQTDGRTDGRTVGQTDGQTDGRTDVYIYVHAYVRR